MTSQHSGQPYIVEYVETVQVQWEGKERATHPTRIEAGEGDLRIFALLMEKYWAGRDPRAIHWQLFQGEGKEDQRQTQHDVFRNCRLFRV